MLDFISFWWTALCESLESSWDKIGEVDLAMTVFSGLFLVALKKSPLSRWSFHPTHPVWSETWRLFALLAALFAVTLLVYAPFQQFEKEHEAKIEDDKRLAAMQIAQSEMSDDLKESHARADKLSDALNMSRDSVKSGEQIKELEDQLSSQKLTFSEVVLKQQQEIDALTKTDSALAPRIITDDQKKAFVGAMKNQPKGPVAVFIISNAVEATTFANQLRSMLDEAGYGDPDKKNVTPSIASLEGDQNPAGSCLAIRPEDIKLPFAGSVQAALIALHIPAAGTVDANKALGLKPGEIAVVVQGK